MDESERKLAYKAGFLTKLAELGVEPDRFYTLTKEAIIGDFLGQFAAQGIGKGIDMASAIPDYGATALKYLGAGALAAPVALGGGAGMAHAIMDAPTQQDMDLMRKAELVGLYSRLAREIQERHRRKMLEGNM